jgi:hypothetical protein
MPYDQSIRQAFEDAQSVFAGFLGEDFTIEGDATTYEGIFDEDVIKRPVEDNGMGIMEEMQGMSLYAVISQFSSGYNFKGVIGKRITRATTIYRCITMHEDRIGIQFELEDVKK